MTRRRDLMCEDIFGCDHKPEIPFSKDGQLDHWKCRCGGMSYPAADVEASKDRSSHAKETK